MTHSGSTAARTGDGARSEFAFWRDHTTISLQPVAAPSILGLYGFAVATFMVAANLAGWYGDGINTPLILFPFVLTFGGIAQLLAAMWAYRARDGLATGIHGAWGSFWIAYGIYQLLVALAVLPPPAANVDAAVAFGYWFIGLAAITWVGFVAALAENLANSLFLLALAAGSTLLAIGFTTAISGLVIVGAILWIASAVLAWYIASAMVLQSSTKRVMLPMGARGQPQAPGAFVPRQPIQYEAGEPGVKIGQ
ncbi:MAG: acetate uptake transporter family protein [Pseudonocardiaceae bacterium]